MSLKRGPAISVSTTAKNIHVRDLWDASNYEETVHCLADPFLQVLHYSVQRLTMRSVATKPLLNGLQAGPRALVLKNQDNHHPAFPPLDSHWAGKSQSPSPNPSLENTDLAPAIERP